MAENTEVQVAAVLKLEDRASSALSSIKSGFDRVSGAAGSAVGKLADFAKQTAAVAIGVNIGSMVSGLGGMWTEMIGAAKAHNTEVRHMASTLMMVSDPSRSWGSLQKQAEGYVHQMQMVGIETGTSHHSMVEAFEDISARSSKSTDHITKMVEQAAMAGRIVPGGLEAITQGFQMVEMGVVRARNPIVMLIKQAGLMGGTAKEIAKDMTMMASEDALAKAPKHIKAIAAEWGKTGQAPVTAMAEKAIEIMAAKAKTIPMSMGQLITSIKEQKALLLETVGVPVLKGILDAIRPSLEQLRKYFTEHKDAVEQWAKSLGDKVGAWSKEAAAKMQEAFNYLQTHSNEIWSALEKGSAALMSVLQFMVAHKEIILALAAAKAASGVPGVGAAAQGAGFVVKAIASAGAAGAPIFGMAASAGAMGAAVALGAATLAIAAVGTAAYNAYLLWDETVGVANRGLEAQLALNKKEEAVVDQQIALQGKRAEFIAAQASYANTESMSTGRGAGGNIPVPEIGFGDVLANSLDREKMLVQSDTQAAMADMASQYSAMFNAAAASGNAGLMQVALSTLTNSNALQYSLFMSGESITGGFDALIAALKAAGPEFEQAANNLAELVGKGKGGVPPPHRGPLIGGGNTFNIKQDFRDQDPDRIAIVFQRDLLKAALTPTQSRVGNLG